MFFRFIWVVEDRSI